MTMKKPADAQPEIAEIVTSARGSFNRPGHTPTPSLNRNPNTNPTTTMDRTAGEKNAMRRRWFRRVFFSKPAANDRPTATSNNNVQSK